MILTGLVGKLVENRINKKDHFVSEERNSQNMTRNQFSVAGLVWQIINLIIGIYTFYLAFRCTRNSTMGGATLHLLSACCCSPCYIAYALATKCHK